MLWSSRRRSTDRVLAVCESAIDGLSLSAIVGTDGKRFCSTAGKCRPEQIAAIVSAAKRLSSSPEVWLAFDNDSAGRGMADELRVALTSQLGEEVRILNKFPEKENADWNDMLQKHAATQPIDLQRLP